MSSLTSSALALAAVMAGCSPASPWNENAASPQPATSRATSVPDSPVRVACARNGAALANDCVLEGGTAENALTVRFPDGGFRRIVVTGDGRGVVAADGAVPARVTLVAQGQQATPMIEVRIGGDRFRLPVRGGPDHR